MKLIHLITELQRSRNVGELKGKIQLIGGKKKKLLKENYDAHN